ncbi:biogenesis of lysosome-related organelles complex 1 subunit 5 [Dendroctonus ponderosae]
MLEVTKGISKLWDRLFDQKAFLNGEINFVLNEFELRRGDSEVDNLFKSLESITDIKDTQINRLIEIASEKNVEANQQLSKALNLCSQLPELEQKYTDLKDTYLEKAREKRKEKYEEIMNGITSNYSKIDAEFEKKEVETLQAYINLEAKLK